jgi:hypothetical protein
MTESVTGNVKITANFALAGTVDLGSTAYQVNESYLHTFTNGTGAGAINNIWTDTRTLAASTTEDLDLAGGVANAFGSTLTFTKIKGIIIHAASTNTNNVVVGGDSNGLIGWVGAANDLINVRPGGTFCIIEPNAAGYAVTAGTGDILQIANSSSGSSVVYDIIILGCV